MTELKFKLVTQPAEHGSTRTFIAADGGDDDGLFIAEAFGGHAEFLVRAANAHDQLVAACEEMRRTFGPATGREISDVTRRELAPWIPMLDAALALAGKAKAQP